MTENSQEESAEEFLTKVFNRFSPELRDEWIKQYNKALEGKDTSTGWYKCLSFGRDCLLKVIDKNKITN